jgi:hypothetical protein
MFFGGGYAYHPRPRYAHQQQYVARPRLTWQLVALLGFMVVLWLYTIFDQSDSGVDWSRLITFGERLDRQVYAIFVSPRMQKKFGVKKNWISDMKRANKMTDEMYHNMKEAADDLYIRHLRERCHRERLFARSHPSCDELREHHVQWR